MELPRNNVTFGENNSAGSGHMLHNLRISNQLLASFDLLSLAAFLRSFFLF